MADDKLKKPEKDIADLVHTLVRAGLGTVPIAGTSLNELFCVVFQPPIDKRRDRWIESIAKDLAELQEKVASHSPETFFSDLQNNENFISVVIKVSRIAAAEHQEAKLEILRNVILNVAIGIDIEEDRQFIFLRIIEDLTPSHIGLLKKVMDPNKVFRDEGLREQEINAKIRSIGFKKMWELVFPEYIDTMELYELLMDDLESRNLITLQEKQAGWRLENETPKGKRYKNEGVIKWGKGLTTIGQQFVDFITRPS